MAEIVLGLGSSHSPQMSSGTRYWEGHAGRDRANDYLAALDTCVVSDALDAEATTVDLHQRGEA